MESGVDEDDESLESQVKLIEREFEAEPTRDGQLAVIRRHISPAEKADQVCELVEQDVPLFEAIMAGPSRNDLVEWPENPAGKGCPAEAGEDEGWNTEDEIEKIRRAYDSEATREGKLAAIRPYLAPGQAERVMAIIDRGGSLIDGLTAGFYVGDVKDLADPMAD